MIIALYAEILMLLGTPCVIFSSRVIVSFAGRLDSLYMLSRAAAAYHNTVAP